MIAYFFLNESIIPLEIFGMIACFTAVVVIAITAEEKEEHQEKMFFKVDDDAMNS